MPNPFDLLPPTLFAPLAAPGAEVYAEVLLRVYLETQRQSQPLSRDLIMQTIRDILSDESLYALTEEAGEEAGDDDDTLGKRAGAILRYLSACGWLKTETQANFTQVFILPAYAFRLLNTLHDLVNERETPLQGLILSIHDLLQAAAQREEAHVRLPEAHRQTVQLIGGLRELQHNIGLHLERVLQQLKTKDVLEQVFSGYRHEIVHKAYHGLRTSDHVSRYRPGILEALRRLERDGVLEAAAARLHSSRDERGHSDALVRLSEQLYDLRTQFEGLDALLASIDLRHGQFVEAAVRTVELHLMASSSISGQLNSILGTLLTNPDLPLPDDLVRLHELTLLDDGSLATPTKAAEPFIPEATPAPNPSEGEKEKARAETLAAMRRAISRERVRRYAQTLLGDKDEVLGRDILIGGTDDLPLLIYLRAYGDGTLGYTVEELEEGVWLERAGIGFRDFVLRAQRKEEV